MISFKVSFNQDFLTYAGNLVTSENFLGYGMKCDIYEPDSTKLGNALFNSFETALNILCKPFPILFSGSSDTFFSFSVCLIRSRILNLASLALISGCILLLSQMSLRSFVLIDPSSQSSSVCYSSTEAKIDSPSSILCQFSTKFISSNCAIVITLPVFHEMM